MFDTESWRLIVALERERGERRMHWARELERLRPPRRHLLARLWLRRGAEEDASPRGRALRQLQPQPGGVSPVCRDC